MKRTIIFFSFCIWASLMNAQLTLDQCRKKAQENYPLVRQYGLIEKSTEYNLSNASKGHLPQFALSGKATYQSDVTELPVKLPGVDLKGMSKDQYQLMLEVKQDIWDGGEIRAKKQQLKASSDVEREKLNVDMYALNDRINQLYFGILMLDEQLTQNQLLHDDLERSHKQVSAYIANGIANQSDLDAVSVELLNTKQKRVDLESSRKAYVEMLSLFLGERLSDATTLQKPSFEDSVARLSSATASVSGADLSTSTVGNINSDSLLLRKKYAGIESNRPELNWFDAQGKSLQVQRAALNTRLMPHLGLFVQGAYGNPGLNMLKNEFTPYYVAGVRLSWNFGSLYTLRNDRRLIDNGFRQLESNRDVFLFNTTLQSAQQTNAIQSMRKQMVDDDEIIRLRSNIRKAAEAKVANGTMTVTDMLREITSENLARQVKSLHEIQLLMNVWNLKYTLNK